MSDENERSVASAGSQPVAWAVTDGPPGDLSVYEAFADHQKDEAMSLARECLFGETNRPLPLAPLYFAPTLTEAEQLAIAWAAREADEWDEEDTPEVAAHAEALRGLAKRLS